MSAFKHMLLASVVLHVYTISRANEADVLRRLEEKLLDVQHDACPYQIGCRNDDETPDFIMQRGFTSCCTDCICNATCRYGIDDSCCFATNPSMFLSNEECMYPGLTSIDLEAIGDYTHYKIVTGRPPNGCTEKLYSENDDSKENDENKSGNLTTEAEYFWGGVLPVFSPSTGRIYWSARLARCHGAADGVEWTAQLACAVEQGFPYTATVANLLQNIEASMAWHDLCHITFVPPTNIRDKVKRQICFPQLIGSCPDDFNMPTDNTLNVTKEEVIVGCKTIFSPYNGKDANFANIFCFLCNSEYFSKNALCQVGDSRAAMVGSFATIIDIKAINSMSKSQDVRLNDQQNFAVNKFNKSDVRVILCPSGKVRVNNECIWPVSHVIGSQIGATLKLTLPQPVATAEIDKKYNEIPETWCKSPWPNSWVIEAIYYVLNNADLPVGMTNSIVVELFQNRALSFRSLVQKLEKSLSQHWLISLGDKHFPANQTFLEFFDLTLENDFTMRNLWTDENVTTSRMQIVYRINMPVFIEKIHITELLFCDQVELRDGEFQLYSGDKIMYVVSTNSYLLQGQFSLVYKDQGKTTKICLKNSPFVQMSRGGGVLLRPLKRFVFACALYMVIIDNQFIN